MDHESYAAAVHKTYESCIEELERNKARFVKNPERDFSRERKISFSSCVHFCVEAGGGALQSELLRHFSFAQTTPTKSAFCQQREKISPQAFAHLFAEFTDAIHALDAPKTWKGYQILASDGSAIYLPYNPADVETFQQNGEKKGYNQLHLTAFYQMLDGYYRDCVVAPTGQMHERDAANAMIDRFPRCEKAILLLDRGFESYNTLAHLLLSGQKFVLRAKDIDSNGILSTWSFPQTGEFDCQIETVLTRVRTRQTLTDIDTYTVLSPHTPFDFLDEQRLFFPMKLRVVRMEIAPGVFECVFTNLDADEFPPQEIKKLYHMRWGEETSFRDLKYTLDLLHFHARKRSYVEQEIYAGLVRFNFCGAICHHIDSASLPNADHSRKYDYQICFAAAVTICLEYMKRACDSMNPCALIVRFQLPVKPDRTFPRNIKPRRPRSFFYRAS